VSIKRLFDFSASLPALVLLSPLLVRVKLGLPILFRQQRPGRHGQPFISYKFRAPPRVTHFSPPGPDGRDHWRLIARGM